MGKLRSLKRAVRRKPEMFCREAWKHERSRTFTNKMRMEMLAHPNDDFNEKVAYDAVRVNGKWIARLGAFSVGAFSGKRSYRGAVIAALREARPNWRRIV